MKRFLKFAGWSIAVLLALRVLLALLFIPALGWIAGSRGLELRALEHTWSLWSLELTIDSLELRARDERGAPRGAPILELDHLGVNISSTALLRGKLVFERVDLDGLRVEVSRSEAGILSWSRYLPASTDAPPAEAEPVGPIHFDGPLEVQELRVTGVQVHWMDAARTPALDARIEAEISADALFSREQAGTLRLLVHSPELLESLRIEGTLFSSGRKLDAKLETVLERANLVALGPELRQMGLELEGEALSARLALHADLDAVDAVDADAVGGEIVLDELSAERAGESLIDLRELRLDIESLRRAPDSSLQFTLAAGSLSSGALTLLPRGHAPIHIESEQLRIGRLLIAQPMPPQECALGIALRSPGVCDAFKLEGALSVAGQGGSARARLDVSGFHPQAIASLLAGHGVIPEVRDGRLELGASASWDTQGWSASLEQLRWQDQAPLLECDKLDFTARPGLEVELAGLRGAARVLEDGRMLIAGFATRDALLPPMPGGLVLDPKITRLGLREGGQVQSIEIDAAFAAVLPRVQFAAQREQSGAVRATLEADGIQLAALKALLEPKGWMPMLEDGALRARVELDPVAGAWDFALRELELRTPSQALLGITALKWSGIAADYSGSQSLQIEGAHVALGRDAAGNLLVPGLRQEPVRAPTVAASQPAELCAPELPQLPAMLPAQLRAQLRIDWKDALAGVELPIDLQLDSAGLDPRSSAGAALNAGVRINSSTKPIQLGTRLRALEGGMALALEWDAQEQDLGALAAYLPADWQLHPGALRTRGSLEAQVGNHPEGGLRLQLGLKDCQIASTGEADAWISIPSMNGGFARFDPLRGVYLPESLQLSGAQLRFARAADGRVSLLGLDSRAALLDPGAAQDTSVRLELERVAPAAGSRREGLRAQLSLPGWVEQLGLEIGVEEVAARTWDATLRLSAQGLHAQALLAALPGLPEGYRAGALEGAGAEVELAVRAAFARPLSGSVALRKFALRAPDGRVLAGLDALESDSVRLLQDPVRLSIGDLRIRTPRLSILRDEQGFEVAGLRLPDDGAQAAPAAAVTSSGPQADPGSSASPAAAATDLSVRSVDAEGLDFEFVDARGSQPTRLRLDALDFEVGRFSLKGLDAGKSLRFHGSVRGAKTPLPKVHRSGSLLALLGHAGASLLGGGSKESVELEERPWLDELDVRGRVQLKPELVGWVQVQVMALELLGLRTLARDQGLEIGDGTLDNTLMLRLRGKEGIAVKNDSVFTNLSLSEPAGGPLSTLLRLPAPLDTVLFLLRNDADELRIPVRVEVPPGGVRSGAVTGAVLGAISSMITSAVASSPLRLLGGVTALLGVQREPALESHALRFEPGSVDLGAESLDVLRKLTQRYGENGSRRFVLQSLLSSADVQVAELRANPSREDALALSKRLRQRKAEIMRERGELLTRIRVDLATGAAREAEQSRAGLASLDEELGSVESGLDQLHERFDEGDERRAVTRTRRFCLGLARERAARLRQRLYEAGVRPERIELRPVKLELVPDGQPGCVQLELRKRTG